MNKKYKNLKLTIDRDHAETVSGIIGYLLNPDGIEEKDLGHGRVGISVFISFDGTVTDEHIRKLLSQNLGGIEHELEIRDFEYDPATETDWKKYFKPQKIGKFITVKPSWEEYAPSKNEIVVTIDPGTAFGTGLHETTRGVIVLLEQAIETRKGKKQPIEELSLLDAGTGSGILAIAAYKMGINNILAIDNDTEAVDTAQDNLRANGIKSGISIEQSTLEDIHEAGAYDIVLANIISEVLIQNKNSVARILKNGADLILSGILSREEQKVIEEFSGVKGLSLFKRLQIEEWSTLWFRSEELK